MAEQKMGNEQGMENGQAKGLEMGKPKDGKWASQSKGWGTASQVMGNGEKVNSRRWRSQGMGYRSSQGMGNE